MLGIDSLRPRLGGAATHLCDALQIFYAPRFVEASPTVRVYAGYPNEILVRAHETSLVPGVGSNNSLCPRDFVPDYESGG